MGAAPGFSLGVEDEVMLLDAQTHALAHHADAALAAFSDELRVKTSPETHACVIELRTRPHTTVPGAIGELVRLRSALAAELAGMGLRPAAAGTHPLAPPGEGEHSTAGRYELVAATMRWLARREPTMALHVHVGIPAAEDAIRVLNRLRESVPVLIALSSNSPFAGGADAGFASSRTTIFGGFPRTGVARPFSSYFDYVEAIDAVIASHAIPDPTFLWWDVRLQPRLGTVEVRAMDAPSTLTEAAALVALVQSLARLELEGEPLDHWTGPEVLAENRFLACRDGVYARLIDPTIRRLVPIGETVERLVEACRPHAAALGCAAALDDVPRLLESNGAARQRTHAALHGLASVPAALADHFNRREFPPC
jgi:glutamate---cysteine ligase / carboxylate-amine ligase